MVTTKREHWDSVQCFKAQMVQKIFEFMKKHESIEFKHPFKIYVEEETLGWNGSDGINTILVPLVAYHMYDTGCIRTDDGEVMIAGLSLHELAYILDTIDSGDYIVDDDEFIDPAGGRGLHSHI